jgi:hypothetical protein
MNDSIVNEILTDLNKPDREKRVIKESEKKLFNIETNTDANIRSLSQIKSNIEENRNMIISNYSSALNINTDLAKNNTENIFKNKISLLSRIVVNDENEELYISLNKDKVKLEYFSHLITINEKTLKILKLIADINTQLIKINEDIMKINQYIVEFNKENIESNKEMMKSEFSCPSFTEGDIKKSEEENIKLAQDLEKKSKSNQNSIRDLSKQTTENSNSILKNRNLIIQRRDSIMSNSDAIEINKSKIFYNL